MTRKLLLIGAIAALSLPAAAEAQGRGRNVDGVPPGHRPPAGMCRIWIDGVPPGRQPAPTSCREALRNRPSNARVIYGDDARVSSKGKHKYKGKHKKGERYEDRHDHDDDRYESRRDRDDDRYESRRDDDDRYERERRSGTVQERIEEARRRRDSTSASASSDTVRRTSVGGVVICTDSQGRNRICN